MKTTKSFNEKLVAALSPKNEKESNEMKTEILHLRLMDKIRLIMMKNRMNQTELAGKLGVSKGFVSQLFSGDKLLNLNILRKMQDVFGVLFELNEIENPYQTKTISMVEHILNL